MATPPPGGPPSNFSRGPRPPRPARPPANASVPGINIQNNINNDYAPAAATPPASATSGAAYLSRGAGAPHASANAGSTIVDVSALPREVEGILAEVKASYSFICEPEYQEVPFALQILDGPGGRSLRSFENMFERLRPCLDLLVSDHHASFNFAVQYYTETTESLTDALQRIQKMRSLLLESRDNLHLRHFDLTGLWEKSQSYSEMLRIINLIDELRLAPQRIENLALCKYYFSAVQRLLDATSIANGPDCRGISALDEIRKTLSSLREKIFDSLVNDIGSHVYLKSPFAEDRWTSFYRSYTSDQQKQQPQASSPHPQQQNQHLHQQPQMHQMAVAASSGLPFGQTLRRATVVIQRNVQDVSVDKTDLVSMRQNSPGYAGASFSAAPDDEQVFVREDLSKSPEVDSLAFITLCLESLCVLGCLYDGLVQLRQRIGGELFALFEHNIVEFRKSDAFGSTSSSLRSAIMREFCQTLYAKLESVMECHRLICNVVDVMSRRDSFAASGNDSSNLPVYSSADVWQVVLTELRVVLLSHISTNKSNQNLPGLDFFKHTRGDVGIFKITKSTLGATMRDRYNAVMKPPPTENATVSVADPYASEKIVPHSTLFAANTEFISTIYRPTLDFMNRMKIYSARSFVESPFAENKIRDDQFLEDFILNTYIPSTEARVQEHVAKYINGPDGFVVNEDNLLQSAPYLIALIRSLLTTIREVPFQKKEYVRMIQDVLAQYLERCQFQFKECTSFGAGNSEKSNCSSRMWLDNQDLVDLVTRSKFFHAQAKREQKAARAAAAALNPDQQDNSIADEDDCEYLVEEILLQSQIVNDTSFQRQELIFDSRKLERLAYMRVTLHWFTTEVRRSIFARDDDFLLADEYRSDESLAEDGFQDLDNPIEGEEEAATTWEHQQVSKSSSADAMPAQSLQTISEILSLFQITSDLCLVLMRFELRCHTMYFLDLAMREGTYRLDEEPHEPEPYVLQLNNDVIVFEEIFSRCLSSDDSFFVFEGVSLLMAHLLVANAGYIRSMNLQGAHKIIKSIQALHQNLLNIALCSEMRLDHARKYYELYLGGSETLLSNIESQGPVYTIDEYIVMLDFIFGADKLPDLMKSENIDIATSAATQAEKYRLAVERLTALLGQNEAPPDAPQSQENLVEK